jgi:hypothetical protein
MRLRRGIGIADIARDRRDRRDRKVSYRRFVRIWKAIGSELQLADGNWPKQKPLICRNAAAVKNTKPITKY